MWFNIIRKRQFQCCWGSSSHVVDTLWTVAIEYIKLLCWMNTLRSKRLLNTFAIWAILYYQMTLDAFWRVKYHIRIIAESLLKYIDSLGPSDAISRHWSGSTLAQIMACCLTARSHYLNPWWLIICNVLWHSSEGNFIRDTSATIH